MFADATGCSVGRLYSIMVGEAERDKITACGNAGESTFRGFTVETRVGEVMDSRR